MNRARIIEASIWLHPSSANGWRDQGVFEEGKPDHVESSDFLCTGFGPMNSLCDRAGRFEDRIHARTKAVFEYFRLPFESGRHATARVVSSGCHFP